MKNTLYWNDPDPIEGVNYEVDRLTASANEDMYDILYNNGNSEAEVFGHELEFR